VKRGDKIRVKYMDENFVEHEEVVEGYLARVMQHEFDHLDGKMFIDHISPLRKQMIKEKLEAEEVAIFSSNYTLYGSLSNRVMSMLSHYSPRIDQYSIDESFFEADESMAKVFFREHAEDHPTLFNKMTIDELSEKPWAPTTTVHVIDTL
jgi:hypothetical protein